MYRKSIRENEGSGGKKKKRFFAKKPCKNEPQRDKDKQHVQHNIP